MPRFGGIATFMRLPLVTDHSQLDVAICGVPFDIGTSNRPGARFGPRGIRSESVLLRPYNMATRAAPYDHLRIAGTGDVATNPYNLLDSVDRIEAHFDQLMAAKLITLTMGGDHTIVLPILRSLVKRHGPVGVIHIDAHTDINDTMFGERIAHGTRSGERWRRASSTRYASPRSACAAPATQLTTLTGPVSRASPWCRQRSAGVGLWCR